MSYYYLSKNETWLNHYILLPFSTKTIVILAALNFSTDAFCSSYRPHKENQSSQAFFCDARLTIYAFLTYFDLES